MFCLFPVFFNVLIGSYFNYSKMANYRFLIDSNTFWMDSGTSKILSKSGPVTLPTIIKILQKNTRKILEHPWKIWILEIWESENLKTSGSPVYRTSRFFWQTFVFFLLVFYFRIWYYGEMMKIRRRGISWHSFSRRNFSKSLDMNLASIKKHETISW